MTPADIQAELRALGVHADKYLGQHFLIDATVLESMIVEAQKWLDPKNTILEVGPGLGALTKELINQNVSRVVAIEKDPVLAENLMPKFGNPPNLNLICGDILRQLETPGSELSAEIAHSQGWQVIANIPYAITSPLIRKLIAYSPSPNHILMLVQLDLAERICAVAGNPNRGLLTVEVEVFAEAKVLRRVPPEAFWPAPEVESAILLLTKRANPLVGSSDIKQFRRLLIAGFSAKRKQLGNSLSGGLGFSQEKVRELLKAVEIDRTRRAETLSIAEWLKLYKIINKQG